MGRSQEADNKQVMESLRRFAEFNSAIRDASEFLYEAPNTIRQWLERGEAPPTLRPDIVKALFQEYHLLLAEAEVRRNSLAHNLGGRWVFLCHAVEDKPRIRSLAEKLKDYGFSPWVDEEQILPGQDWDLEIQTAVRGSGAVLVCLSEHSVTKKGYVQKELRVALDEASKYPEGAIFLIPVGLYPCETPRRLAHLQRVDLFLNGAGYAKLAKALASVLGGRTRAQA